MFKKLFGGSDKPKQEQKPQEAPQHNNPIPDQKIEIEKLQFEIRQQENGFEEKIEKFTIKIDNLRNQAKEFIKKGQKKQAQYKLQEIQQLEQYISRAENQKQVFLKVRMQLENGLDNKNSADTLTKVAQVLKSIPEDNDRISEAISNFQEFELNQKETDQMFELHANSGVDSDLLDEEYAKLENEMKMEQANQFSAELNNVPHANINTQKNKQAEKQPVYQQQQKQDDAFANALNDQLLL